MLKGNDICEEPVWAGVEGEWRQLFESFSSDGVSVEWYDFECRRTLDWSSSFHPESLDRTTLPARSVFNQICINFEGCGAIHEHSAQTTIVNPQRVARYAADESRLRADRHAGQRHRFLAVELSRGWLSEAVRGHEAILNRETQGFLGGEARLPTAREQPLNPRVQHSAEEMLKPPIDGSGAGFWFRAKILEVAALTLTEPREELFCQRHKRLAIERVERVKQAVARDLESPPALSQLGREVGCSPFYLSRIFSEQTGMTISRYLRNLRLERVAELLRSGRSNVTEAAMAVGYSSLSHFSKAFADMFGVCPCAFPVQRKSGR